SSATPRRRARRCNCWACPPTCGRSPKSASCSSCCRTSLRKSRRSGFFCIMPGFRTIRTRRARLSMQALDVKKFLEEQLPGVQVEVEGAGCSFQLNLIDDALAALSPVKRQQQVYAHLNPWIADG